MKKRPNILFLQTDQHRFDALGCVSSMVKTPRLDALAAKGIRFAEAVCNTPMCVPSRYSMMTGLYSSQCGVRHNTQMATSDDDMVIETIAERLLSCGAPPNGSLFSTCPETFAISTPALMNSTGNSIP